MWSEYLNELNNLYSTGLSLLSAFHSKKHLSFERELIKFNRSFDVVLKNGEKLKHESNPCPAPLKKLLIDRIVNIQELQTQIISILNDEKSKVELGLRLVSETQRQQVETTKSTFELEI